MDDFTLPGIGGGGAQGSHEPITITSHYNKLSESLRRVAPPQITCTVFCGGKRCKYESSTHWASELCALNGLYSTWINDDVLAMCRLNTSTIQEFDIIGQFQTMGIKSVINLQVPGEHSSCSPVPLDSSGFSYSPTFLMDNGIYFYNYSWRDYGDASLAYLLDMVKVLSFAVTQGKVAIHCHAGLGRTGVLIACYLVYSLRMRANDAVRLIRAKRPGSIQSRLHILCVQQFEQFILPNCIIFCNRDLLKDKKIQDFTLQQYLKRQRFILHGKECKTLRHIPKILNVILERLLTLCGKPSVIAPVVFEEDDPPTIVGTPDTIASPIGSAMGDYTIPSSIASPVDTTAPMNNFKMEPDYVIPETTYTVAEVVRALLSDHINMVEGLARYVRQYRLELNHKGMGAWMRLSNEKNLYVLTALFLLWLEHLRVPLLGSEELTTVVLHADPSDALKRLPSEVALSIDYIIHFLANLDPEEGSVEAVLRRLAASFTHRIVPSTATIKVYLGFHTQSSEKGKPRVLNEGTLSKLMNVLHGILELKKNGIDTRISINVTPTSAQSSSS